MPGKTFPVEDLYLEDILETTGHRIPAESEYAVRSQRGLGGGRAQLSVSAGRGNTKTITAEWEDGGAEVAMGCNEWYDDRLFADYSEGTRASLRCVDDERINYDVIEELLYWIDDAEAGKVKAQAPAVQESWEDAADDGGIANGGHLYVCMCICMYAGMYVCIRMCMDGC